MIAFKQVWSESKLQSSGAQPRRNLRLSLSQPKPKALRLTMGSSTPTPNLVGGTIDGESLRRQKQEMGEALSRVRSGSKTAQLNGSTPVPSSAAPSIRRSMSLLTEQTDTAMTDVKVNGTADTPQPHDGAARTSQTPLQISNQQLPTPVQDIEMAMPGAAPLTNGTGTQATSNTPKPAHLTAFNYLNQSIVPMERRYRDPDRGKLSLSHAKSNNTNLYFTRLGFCPSRVCDIHDQPITP